MSLYGRVKRVDSSPFQFDRVYPNRAAMEKAQNTDGVFVGRYILVEYGERYQNVQGQDEVIETEEYSSNKETDKNKYGDTFDSTVWIKIYSGSDEKYVMVAELNAFAPQLELKPEGALLYEETDNSDDKVTIWDNGKKEINNVKEKKQIPYFDMTRNSEVSYDLHMPGPLQLNVDNRNLNLGQEFNNIVYGAAPHSSTASYNDYAIWTPDGITTSTTTGIVESKTLRINYESLGYAIKDLFDLLYGQGTADDGWIRPFFKDGWTQANEENQDEQSGKAKTHYKNSTDSGDLNKDNDKLDWATGINGMIKGADKGLAGIIEDLFASRNPLTGKVIYYLLNAWNLNYLDENQKEQPNISGKPEIITAASYKTTTTDEVTVREFIADEGATACQYGIDYNTWTLTPII